MAARSGLVMGRFSQDVRINGSNILKLHADRVNILRDIVIFIFGPFGLKLPIHVHFWELFGDMMEFPLELGTGATGQKTRVFMATIWLKKF